MNRTLTGIAAGVAVLIAALSGCGNGDGDDDTPVVDRFSALPAYTADPAFASEYDRHIAASHRNTLNDEFMLNTYRNYYCMYPEENVELRNEVRNGAINRVPLTQLFDDVWYIGSHHVGQYIFRSGEGFLVIDSLNNAQEAQTYTVPALSVLGVSTALPFKDLIVTHGHGDHDGGAQELKNLYSPRILTGSADAARKTYAPETIDSSKVEPVRLTLGGRDVILFSTPGHTPGSLSSIVTVKDNGKPVKAVLVGGSAMPGNKAAADNYLYSVERTYDLARTENVTASMQNHPVFDGTLRLMEQINQNGLSKPSPLVIGQERILQGLAILRQCSAANAAKVDPATPLPVWQVAKLEQPTDGPTAKDVSARLTTGWGPVAGQAIIFTGTSSKASCTATTNDVGVARCARDASSKLTVGEEIVASFSGAAIAGATILPASSAATLVK